MFISTAWAQAAGGNGPRGGPARPAFEHRGLAEELSGAEDDRAARGRAGGDQLDLALLHDVQRVADVAFAEDVLARLQRDDDPGVFFVLGRR